MCSKSLWRKKKFSFLGLKSGFSVFYGPWNGKNQGFFLPGQLCMHACSHACMQMFIFSFGNDGSSLLVLQIPLSLKLDCFSLRYDEKSRGGKFPPPPVNRRVKIIPILRGLIGNHYSNVSHGLEEGNCSCSICAYL